MRARYRLTAKGVQGLPPGKYPDGGNLWFLRRPDGGAQWTFRFTLMGRSREMGLGSYPDLTLAEAREEAETWRRVLKQGIDPLSERQRLREEASATLSKGDPALEKFARQVFDRHKGTLRGGGKRGRWLSPLEGHVFPKIGKRRISTITAKDVADVLRPIWKLKHPTAEKAIQRLGIVFREARDKGYTIQAEIIEKAKADLPKIIHKTTHISATPWRDIPALYEKIGQTGHGASYDCLLWLILNPVRATAARGARFSEIHDGVWIIQAERMKAREGQAKDFHLPLSSASLALLEEIRERRKDDLLFPSYRARSPISDAALTKILNEIGEPGRVHGFRTSFRTWVQEETETPWDLAETALAHKVGDSVSESYARGKMLKRLGALYDQWGRYVTKATSGGKVVDLQSARA